jgi:rhodanese-related sulfurtransferase
MFQSITPSQLNQLIASGKQIELIDVRTPVEYRSMHVAVARNEPLDRLDPHAVHAGRNGNSNEPLYVICRSGGRSRQACQQFFSSGFTNVVNVEGGTMACAKAGVPMVRGQKAMPLNCQVQIITGVLVLVGSVMTALSGNLAWLAVPIAMGAGLAFSGATNTCAMGWILAKMPWNQIKEIAGAGQTGPASCSTKSGGSCG